MNDVSLIEDLRRAGLVEADETPLVEALTGGVSSDIVRVRARRGSFCVKRALAKLKVAADWRAPVERNRHEVAWMRVVGAIVPSAVPRILADRSDDGWFAMDYLDPGTHPLWKAQLRDGTIDAGFAAEVGATLSRIHATTSRDATLATRFATDHIFQPIRLDPYLGAAAEKHADCAPQLHALITRTQANRKTLVHGDISPKNILAGPGGPVFLDAECAWWGDPAFDLAFCLNHLLLKCVWRPQWAARYLECFDRLAASYLSGVDWESARDLEGRASALLAGLFLARVDGKSPVEYLTDDGGRARVRRVGRAHLLNPPARLDDLRQAWTREMQA